MVRHAIEGRIVVECQAHNRFQPCEAVSFPPLAIMDAAHGDPRFTAYDNFGYPERNFESLHGVSWTWDADTGPDTRCDHRPFTDEELILAVPYVRGYALKEKTWCLFFVDQIMPIEFAEDAFASLALPADQKSFIRGFAKSQVKIKDDLDAFIARKGRGMVFLLSGQPGVGKTLTGESVAEYMRVPLYTMSGGDLGVCTMETEQTLRSVLDMMSRWNGVVLLDEADVFLQHDRGKSSPERARMVSTFLRVLGNYRGVLFLTTNQIFRIDEALASRIHVIISYPELSVQSRRQIWRQRLPRDHDIAANEVNQLAEEPSNGRKIKNVLKMAQILVHSENKGVPKARDRIRLTLRHIDTVLLAFHEKAKCRPEANGRDLAAQGRRPPKYW